MRKFFVLLAVTVIALMIGADSPKVTKAQDTSGMAQPGTRCTRLTLGPKPKKVKPKAVQAIDGIARPGTRCTRLTAGGRKGAILPNMPPYVGLAAKLDGMSVMGDRSGNIFTGGGRTIEVRTLAWDPDGDTMLYTYSPTGGRIFGDGPDVFWDISGLTVAGTYTITVEVDDGCGCIAFSSASVTVPK